MSGLITTCVYADAATRRNRTAAVAIVVTSEGTTFTYARSWNKKMENAPMELEAMSLAIDGTLQAIKHAYLANSVLLIHTDLSVDSRIFTSDVDLAPYILKEYGILLRLRDRSQKLREQGIRGFSVESMAKIGKSNRPNYQQQAHHLAVAAALGWENAKCEWIV